MPERTGCSGIPDWFPFVGFISRHCECHDIIYARGGDRQTKNAADALLGKRIRRSARGKSLPVQVFAFVVGLGVYLYLRYFPYIAPILRFLPKRMNPDEHFNWQ